jgi:hypothetical protein
MLGSEEQQPVRSRAAGAGEEGGDLVELRADDGPQIQAADLILGTPVLGENDTDPVRGPQIRPAAVVGVREAVA